jgi:hypothetical protein
MASLQIVFALDISQFKREIDNVVNDQLWLAVVEFGEKTRQLTVRLLHFRCPGYR